MLYLVNRRAAIAASVMLFAATGTLPGQPLGAPLTREDHARVARWTQLFAAYSEAKALKGSLQQHGAALADYIAQQSPQRPMGPVGLGRAQAHTNFRRVIGQLHELHELVFGKAPAAIDGSATMHKAEREDTVRLPENVAEFRQHHVERVTAEARIDAILRAIEQEHAEFGGWLEADPEKWKAVLP